MAVVERTIPEVLDLEPEIMREAGARVMAMVIDHLTRLHDKPVTATAGLRTLRNALGNGFGENGEDLADVLDLVERELLTRNMFLSHPRFFAFVPSPSNFVSILGDLLATAYNVWPATWLTAAGGSATELECIDWMCSICGLPDGSGGLFVSGGSMANLTALATARDVKLRGSHPDAVIYCSDQAHSSVARALHILGFNPHQLVILPSGADLRLPIATLARRLVDDRAHGRRPFCVVASAGTTNAGTVDSLETVAELCAHHDLWLHVDGAIGAAAMLSPGQRERLRGLDRADSITFDPHKGLFQPFDIGAVLVRRGEHLRECFHVLPEYLQDAGTGPGEVNFCDEGIELARRFRALKLWMSLKAFGVAAFRAAVERGIGLAEYAEAVLRDHSDWEVTSPAQLGIVTFRYVGASGFDAATLDSINGEITHRMRKDGYAMVASTRLRGCVVLRLCINNPRTTDDDLVETIDRLHGFGIDIEHQLRTNHAKPAGA